MQIQQDTKLHSTSTKRRKPTRILKKKMSAYEIEGVRETYLSCVYGYLWTIKLLPAGIDVLWEMIQLTPFFFLRYIFQNQQFF